MGSRARISAFMPGGERDAEVDLGQAEVAAVGAHHARSCASASIAPAANAWPCSAATIGAGNASTRANRACTSRRFASAASGLTP